MVKVLEVWEDSLIVGVGIRVGIGLNKNLRVNI